MSNGILGVIDIVIALISAIIPVLVGFAVVVFFWGVVKFIAHSGDEKALQEGKQLMIWGMIGIFVIVALWSVVGYIQMSLGLNLVTPSRTAPSAPTVIPAI
ncbi:MAG: hypothetical protein A2942_01320 [Candidatus Lloydbacteria bacterium RIFCSPLOWO2_01_FULL_50_20]|uniref:Uncharacterized protein n=1 Tax=Candidatus Lloydbacteria bacterium RIFCSPLOWO2_01_FULL_50_20 TaxID=1798665 RepID=A0A1G2DIS2_9BACT|nr:MAG: hypothetical protein A3C13_00865 [Candidatus Lloydbacteria bacterium RIFCSPHIGHO2_02_FULL_50_11]OGZ13466.1 MAG: hypothetical protein A2942_01320 [Candidatus Lloydbacteria bacterium RIFCSPLOWO2_01_FULL_50_20]